MKQIDNLEYEQPEALWKLSETQVEENGFLVLISVYKDELFVTTKSNPEGKMAEIARELVGKMLSAEAAAELKNYLCQNNCTLLCEGICPTEDPHIISYERDDLIMLDLVKNAFTPERARQVNTSGYGFFLVQINTIIGFTTSTTISITTTRMTISSP